MRIKKALQGKHAGRVLVCLTALALVGIALASAFLIAPIWMP